MSAIFPPPAQGGVPPGTPGVCNAYTPTNAVIGGGPYFIAPDCSTLLTDCQVNGITSEILAAVDLLGCNYQFNQIDNLGRCLNFRFNALHQLLQDQIDNISTSGLSVHLGPTPPSNPEVGWLWWDTTIGQLFVWYQDPNSAQWVVANSLEEGASGGGGIEHAPANNQWYASRNGAWQAFTPGAGATVSVGATPPLNPSVGALWWDTTVGHLFIWYTDPNSSQWVSANTIGGGIGINPAEYATRTWVLQQIALGGTFIDAPADGEIYARQDNDWVVISAAGADGGTY